MELLQIIVPLIIFMLLVVPMGKYVYCVATGDKAIGDNFFNRIDNFIYKICGINKDEEMSKCSYGIYRIYHT